MSTVTLNAKNVAEVVAAYRASESYTKLSASNVKKADAVITMLSHSKIIALFSKAHVATNILSDLYAAEKLVKLAYNTIVHKNGHAKDIENNSYVAFRSYMNALQHNDKLLYSDLDAAIMINSAVSEERKHIVFARTTKIDSKRQVDAVRTMLEDMKAIVADDRKRTTFTVQSNALTVAIAERISEVLNAETAESNSDAIIVAE